MWQDIRIAVRGFRQSPGFTLTALVTLTLAIGANAAVFSLISALLLRDANVRDPQSLVQVGSLTQPQGIESGLTCVWASTRVARISRLSALSPTLISTT